ncbi:MAG: hypothetical protein ABSG96_21755 [Terracidiphilus sp.]
MADTFHRNSGDQAAYGYRQLSGTGPASGPDLRTMVYGTFAVALGIVIGTLAADGTLRSISPFASHQSVRAGSSAPAVSGRPGTQAQTAQLVHPATSPGNSQPSVTQKPSAAVTSTATTISSTAKPLTAALSSTSIPASTVAKTLPPPATTPIAKQSAVPQPTIASKTSATAKATTVANSSTPIKSSGLAQTSDFQKVAAAHRHWSTRRIAARVRWLAWRKLHPRHRLHGYLKAAMATPSKLPDLASVPKPAELPKHVPAPAPLRFSFFVEGSVSVANYDASTGVVDTYEGESFAVDRMTKESRTISWLEYPADVHYRCDQSWNCTLFHAGVLIVNARRTK